MFLTVVVSSLVLPVSSDHPTFTSLAEERLIRMPNKSYHTVSKWQNVKIAPLAWAAPAKVETRSTSSTMDQISRAEYHPKQLNHWNECPRILFLSPSAIWWSCESWKAHVLRAPSGNQIRRYVMKQKGISKYNLLGLICFKICHFARKIKSKQTTTPLQWRLTYILHCIWDSLFMAPPPSSKMMKHLFVLIILLETVTVCSGHGHRAGRVAWCSQEHPLWVFEEDRLLRMAAAMLLPLLPFKRLQTSMLLKLRFILQ